MREELSTEWKDLRQRLGNLICRIDGQMASLSAEEKRMEERRDESYWKGVHDLYEAVKAVALSIEDGGMTSQDILEYFGTSLALNAISKTDPKNIMEKVSEWKADKERAPNEENEFQVGDEVESKDSYLIGWSKAIITETYNDRLYVAFRNRLNSNHMDFFSIGKDNVTKTGRHFDNIPFTYGQEKEKEEEQEDSKFHDGDEVELEPGCIGEPRKGIITGIIDANLISLVYRLSDDGELRSCRVVGKRYKKTGRHFDSIPFMYGC